MSVVLRHNGTYDDMVRELNYGPSNLIISYLMNAEGKIHPYFITNDRQVRLCLFDYVPDGSRLVFWVKVVERHGEEEGSAPLGWGWVGGLSLENA